MIFWRKKKKMNVEFIDFKCFENKKIFIQNKYGLVLIEGESGSGKSTLLNGIYYCLNGGRKGGKSVIVNFENYSFIRLKNPNRFIVKTNTFEFKDKDAQTHVEDYFKINYTTQDGFDWFLMATNAERKKYLENLNDDSSLEILNETIPQKLKNVEFEYNRLKNRCDLLQVQMEKFSSSVNIHLDEQILNEKRNEISNQIAFWKTQMNIFQNYEKVREFEGITLDNFEENKKKLVLHKNFVERTKILQELEKYQNIDEKYEHFFNHYCKFKDDKIKRTKYENIVEKMENNPLPTVECPWCLKDLIIVQNKLMPSNNKNINGKRTWEEHVEFLEAENYLQNNKVVEFNTNDFEQIKQEKTKSDMLKMKLNQIKNYSDEEIKDNLEEVIEKQTKLSHLNSFNFLIPKYSFHEIEEKINFFMQEQKYLDEQFKTLFDFNQYKKLKSEFDIENNQYLQIEQDFLNIKKIYKIWIETKQESLFSLIKTLQFNVNEILQELFSSPMTIVLSPITSTNKPELEIEIFYKNLQLSVADLSGGEKARVSIAFTLAFSQMQDSKFIMMDEPCVGLDRENCIKTCEFLKSFCIKNKILILMTGHNIINLFDEIISLK